MDSAGFLRVARVFDSTAAGALRAEVLAEIGRYPWWWSTWLGAAASWWGGGPASAPSSSTFQPANIRSAWRRRLLKIPLGAHGGFIGALSHDAIRAVVRAHAERCANPDGSPMLSPDARLVELTAVVSSPALSPKIHTRTSSRTTPTTPRARRTIRDREPNPRFPAQIHHPHVVGVAAGGEPSRRPHRHIPGNPRARRRTRAHGASRGSHVARVGRERGRRVVHTTDARGRRRSRGVHLRVLLRSTRTERTLVAWAPGRYHTLLFVARCVADRFIAGAFPRERRRVILGERPHPHPRPRA